MFCIARPLWIAPFFFQVCFWAETNSIFGCEIQPAGVDLSNCQSRFWRKFGVAPEGDDVILRPPCCCNCQTKPVCYGVKFPSWHYDSFSLENTHNHVMAPRFSDFACAGPNNTWAMRIGKVTQSYIYQLPYAEMRAIPEWSQRATWL